MVEFTGKVVYSPARDTNQSDPEGGGLAILEANQNAIKKSRRIAIFWNPNSVGSIGDFHTVLGLKKRIELLNVGEVARIVRGERAEGNMKSHTQALWAYYKGGKVV